MAQYVQMSNLHSNQEPPPKEIQWVKVFATKSSGT